MANEDAVNNPYQQQQQQTAQQYGLTADQLSALYQQYPPVQQQNSQGGQYGMSSGVSLQQNPQLTNVLNTLQAQKQFGLGGSGQQQTGQAPSSVQGQVSTDPVNAATNLGAAALGMPAVYNPTPGQIPVGSKGGVSQVASPVSSGTVPGVPAGPWNTTAGVFGNQQQVQGMQNWAQHGGSGNPADAAAIERQQGWAPGTIANQFAGTSTPNPGTTLNAQGQLPGTPTGTPIPNPRGSAPATPWAQAPPAPGTNVVAPTAGTQPIQPPDFATHNMALQNAGKAIYAHYGGDPDSASPTDIANFHTQLASHIGGVFGGAPAGAQNYTAGLPPGASTAGPAPVKAATGGLVTPIGMDDGGQVDPPEARRRTLTTTGQPATSSSGVSNPVNQPPSSTSPPPSTPPDYSAFGGNNWSQMAQIAQQGRAAQAANAAVGSGGPGSIDSLGTLGDESIITGQGGPGQPGGPGSATMAGASAISGLAQGLTQAAQTYANSVKPWQPQQNAIGKFGNAVASSQPAANFQQPQTGQGQQQKNPYAALMPYQT